MTNIVRLRRYKTYLSDGRSSVEYVTDKGFVTVAIVLGHEPLVLTEGSAYVDIDGMILRMAEHILKQRKKQKHGVAETMTAAQWNATYPVGTPVLYRPVITDAACVRTKTRSEAWELGHGEAVVKVAGHSGGVPLMSLEVAVDGERITNAADEQDA